MITREAVIETLKQCYDPELNIDVWTLGLIYDIKIEEEKVDIRMTFTSPFCPYGPWLLNTIKEKLTEATKLKTINLEVVFEPVWRPSDDIKLILGME